MKKLNRQVRRKVEETSIISVSGNDLVYFFCARYLLRLKIEVLGIQMNPMFRLVLFVMKDRLWCIQWAVITIEGHMLVEK